MSDQPVRQALYPATVCSQACYSEAYGESKRELYEDERHESGVEDDETESEGD